MALDVAITIALYSSSVKEILTVSFFLLLQVTIVDPKLKEYLDVDFLMLAHPNESKFMYPYNLNLSF